MINVAQCRVVVAHNAKFDCGFIYHHYGVLLRNWWCTQIASQLCTNGKIEFQGKHTLPEVIERFLDEKIEFQGKKKILTKRGKVKDFDIKKLLQKSFTSSFSLDDFTAKQLRYASSDVQFLLRLYAKQQRSIDKLGLKAIVKLETDLVPVLAKMEMEGCLIDANGWRNLIKDYWIPDVERIEKQLDEEVKRLIPSSKSRRVTKSTQFGIFGEVNETRIEDKGSINFGSSDQIIQLFNSLGEEVPTIEVEEKKKNGRDNNILNNLVCNLELFSNYSGNEQPSGSLGSTVRQVPKSGEKIKKESLEEGVLTTYINERPNSKMRPFIKLLIEYRVAMKKISTYGEKFLSMLDSNGRIHTGYTQTFTETGRLSSKAPNLQNIPAPQKGKPQTDIRRFFIARPGYSLITCDMAGAEVAIAADYSQEPLLLASLREGVDMHSQLASISFGIICGEQINVSKSEEPIYIKGHELIPVELRDQHKSVVFAKFYKGGAKRVYGVLAEYINMFHSEDKRMEIASQISRALDKRMPVLSKYLTSLIDEANEKGYLRGSKLGRIRFFPEGSYGECANYPIQNTNAEALKMALVEVFLYFESCGYDGRIVMNIHDEVVCEVEESKAEEAAQAVKEIVARNLSYFLKTIKGGASVSISKWWKK